MIQIDCTLWSCPWWKQDASRRYVRVEFQSWIVGYQEDKDWFNSAESMLHRQNSNYGMKFHVRVTFDPRLRPAWERPPWQQAAMEQWHGLVGMTP